MATPVFNGLMKDIYETSLILGREAATVWKPLCADESRYVASDGETVKRPKFGPDDFYGSADGNSYADDTKGRARVSNRTPYGTPVPQRAKVAWVTKTLTQEKEIAFQYDKFDRAQQFIDVVEEAGRYQGLELGYAIDDRIRSVFDTSVPSGNKSVITATAAHFTGLDKSVPEDLIQALNKLQTTFKRAGIPESDPIFLVVDPYIEEMLANYFVLDQPVLGGGSENDRFNRTRQIATLMGLSDFVVDNRLPDSERLVSAGTGRYPIRIGVRNRSIAFAESVNLSSIDDMPGTNVVQSHSSVKYDSYVWIPEILWEITFTLP